MKIIKLTLLAILPLISANHGDVSFESKRIAGGSEAEDGAAPYQVAIVQKPDNIFVYSGVILTARSILTTANGIGYMGPDEMYIIAGTNEIFNGGSRYNIEKITPHPRWDAGFFNDIAILTVEDFIEFSELVSPIAIDNSYVGRFEIVTITGWGKINDDGDRPTALQTVDLLTTGNEECKVYLGLNYPYFPVFENHLCTVKSNGQGVCFGDNGGPVVRDGKLVGLVSWGFNCINEYLDVHTRVSAYTEWIDENIL